MKILSAYLRLSPLERRIALESLMGIIAARVWLEVRGFDRSTMPSEIPSPVCSAPDGERPLTEKAYLIARIHAAVERRFFFKPNCLERAMVLSRLLRRGGVPAVIRIGGRKEWDRFAAHAWVEVGKIPLELGNLHREFEPFDRAAALAGNQPL